MKSEHDLAAGWLRKAQSDLTNAELCSIAGKSLDTACFHCQQAAEKALKAFLIAKLRPFPLVHDLSKLLEHCIQVDPSFQALSQQAISLNPYAVTTRYDETFWPDAETVRGALDAARKIYDFAARRFPATPPS